MSEPASPFAGDRLAKVIARAGLCSRRDAELWIKDGRVSVNGKVIRTPAFNITEKDKVKVDGQPLAAREGTRVWLYHKPAGLVVTEKDPEGRPTVFEALEQQGLPRVVSVGRLDINTEGLLLLTNDGGLKRVLELPATGWMRRYRVRAFGSVSAEQLKQLESGITVDGVEYGPIEATLEREQGSNVWLVLGLREGKNREIKNVLEALGLQVNRLIRVSFGPFQLGDLPEGQVEVVRARVLREQLGKRLAEEAGADFDSELPEPAAVKMARGATNPALRARRPGTEPAKQRKAMADRAEPFRFVDRDRPRTEPAGDGPMRKDRPGSRYPRKAAPARAEAPVERGRPRKVFNEDGTESVFEAKSYGRKPKPAAEGDRPARGGRDDGAPRRSFGDRPPRDGGARPARAPAGDRSARGSDERPARRPRSAEGSERPQRAYGDKPRSGFGDKPRGSFGDKPKRPYAPRSAEGTARPRRDDADRPARPAGDRPKRPYSPRGTGTGAPSRPYGDRPARDNGDRPQRTFGDRPAREGGDRPKRPSGDRPRGPRPDGDKPFPKRPRGSGPGGDRPRRPRPPKA